jgi:hypothetical protein
MNSPMPDDLVLATPPVTSNTQRALWASMRLSRHAMHYALLIVIAIFCMYPFWTPPREPP